MSNGGRGVAGNTIVEADFAAPTGKVVHKQLFGAATGGLQNGNFAHCSYPRLRALIRALDLPLFRLHSQWGRNPAHLANLAGHLPAMVPPSCTMVIGIPLGVTQAQAKAISDWWVAHAPLPCHYWEGGNEAGGSVSSYQASFAPLAAGVHQTDPGFKVGGPVWAGSPGTSFMQSFIVANNARTLGFLDFHDYLYCQDADPTPSDWHVAQALMASGRDRFVGSIHSVADGATGTYAANYPILLGEYNIECGASWKDLRAGTCVGAAFLATASLKTAEASPQPVWGAMWDLYDDGGAAYNLIDRRMNVYPQYYTLQRLIAKMPGNMVSVTREGAGAALLAWATVSGADFGVTMVNPTNGPVSGQVALGHWPGNASGNGAVRLWSYPTTNLTRPVANTPGDTTTVSVTAGVTAPVTVPAHSLAILST
jgi:hypothetical protein